MARVVLSPRALEQAKTAAAWWIENREKAPTLFADEFASALRLLASAPEIGVPFIAARREGVRRYLLWRTQYHLYYAHAPERQTVRVLAVWSAVRGRTPRV